MQFGLCGPILIPWLKPDVWKNLMRKISKAYLFCQARNNSLPRYQSAHGRLLPLPLSG